MRAYSYLRFSSNEQAKGDSIRRQIELRDKWLESRGIGLDTSLVYVDKGRSAFRGKHKDTGALAAFLEAVRGNRVRKGSYFIIENLDRLSREDVERALSIFLEIVSAGITIVTLSPEREFASGKLDIASLVIAIVEMCRANSESVAKQARSRANWSKRRANLDRERLTSAVPAWIDADEAGMRLNPAKAATVKRAFSLALNGYGARGIAKLFNREGVPVISKRRPDGVWTDVIVFKILRGRETLGEFQPHTLDADGNRQPVGQPVKGYYPPVVDEDTFYRVREGMRSRKGGGGRTDKGVTNLFTGLVVNPEGVQYHTRTKSLPSVYLTLATSRTGLEPGKSLSVPYTHMETVLLWWLGDLELELAPEDADAGGLEARLSDVKRRIDAIVSQTKANPSARLFAILAELEGEEKALGAELETARIPKHNHLTAARQLIHSLKREEDDATRHAIKQAVRMAVRRIVVERIEGRMGSPKKRYWLAIEFRDGQRRRIWFDTDRQGLDGWGGMYTDAQGRIPASEMNTFKALTRGA
jgi:DNA invertase Pin-like site-specific DNA recombinase